MLSDYHRYRLYEILPGLSVWVTIIVGTILAFVQPVWIIYFMIVFDVYWVLKVFNYSFYLVVAWRRYSVARKIDWRDKLQTAKIEYKNKRHVIFLTVFNEEWSVVKTAIQSVADSVYDRESFTLVIAGEDRMQEHCREIMRLTQEYFADRFDHIITAMHPANLPGEIPGKGSNLHFAEREVKKYIDERSWNYEDVIVTIFDIDTVCHPQYFSYLTYLYCTHPSPTHSSFQPVALYNNNMWESPAVLRVMAFGTTFWLMTSLARQDALVTFSSHSMSFQALVDAGFHDKRIVSEDSRIFYQCLLAYNGDYEVTPMYIPVSMDTVRDDDWWQSIKNLYRQQRRWAWGAEHIPYLLWEFRQKEKLIPWWKKVKWLFIEWEGKWSWCLVAIMISVFPRLLGLVAGESVRQSALFFNAPHLLSTVISSAMIGMLLSALLSFPLLPKRPASHPPHRYFMMLLQWLLLPFSLIFVSALPAIDAVTHLMLGKYLGFNISQKKRNMSHGDVSNYKLQITNSKQIP